MHGEKPHDALSKDDKKEMVDKFSVQHETKHASALMTHDHDIRKCSMVVPVYLSHSSHPEHEVLTYALLDSQSDSSFISEETCCQLGLEGTPVTLKLSTMTADSQTMQCMRLSDLKLRGYNCSTEIPLPSAYSHPSIPANKDSIPTAEVAQQWPYLKPMIHHLMPKQNCEIGLLIGYNCPRALMPVEVIPSVGNGPYAQRTDLGWGVVGPISRNDGKYDSDSTCYHTCSAAIRSVIALRTSAKEIFSPQDVINFKREEGYIHSKDVFIANCVQSTREVSTPDQWHHIPTDQNPADLASHGGNVSDLVASNWFTGPEGHILDDEGFRTLLSEAAKIVNSHSLSTANLNNPTSLYPLTPNHLLTMKTNVVLPPGEFCSADSYCRKRWCRVQYLANAFWERWRKEILSVMQPLSKWNKPNKNLAVGNVVLIVDDALPRTQWKLGRVVTADPGSDGLVRKVQIKVGNPGLGNKSHTVTRYLERPVQKLVLLLDS
jgi:hypothetical protein